MKDKPSRTERANILATRAEAWWSLLEKLWEARGVVSLVVLFGATIASALYSVLGFINQYGWAGWVLASIPSLVVAVLLAMFVNWALHVRRIRRLREVALGAPVEGNAALQMSADPAPTPYSWDDPKYSLTGVERERASAALSAVVDFAATDARHLYDQLREADAAGPWSVVQYAGALEPFREIVAKRANDLWHEHSYYLELMNFDILPLLQTLEALKNPLAEASEAEGWPVNAQADRARPIAQLMSDLGGHIGNIRKDAAEKRREYLE